VTGEVVAVNSALVNKLESLAGDAYQDGWMIKVALSDETALSKLMNAAAYEKQCAEAG
jgi:glycine cleavage system H protein